MLTGAAFVSGSGDDCVESADRGCLFAGIRQGIKAEVGRRVEGLVIVVRNRRYSSIGRRGRVRHRAR